MSLKLNGQFKSEFKTRATRLQGWLQMTQDDFKMTSRWLQDDFKMTSRWLQDDQDDFKMTQLQDDFKMTSRWLQDDFKMTSRMTWFELTKRRWKAVLVSRFPEKQCSDWNCYLFSLNIVLKHWCISLHIILSLSTCIYIYIHNIIIMIMTIMIIIMNNNNNNDNNSSDNNINNNNKKNQNIHNEYNQ